MDIERINEYTVKFFVSNRDIEERGFVIDDLWSDRQRGEQILWEMLDDIQDELEFQFEGLLKIQVNVSDQGLEFVVSKSPMEYFRNKKLKSDSNKRNAYSNDDSDDDDDNKTPEIELTVTDSSTSLSHVFILSEFEDVVSLFSLSYIVYPYTRLFYYESKYYLEIYSPDTDHNDGEEISEKESEILYCTTFEFAEKSNISSMYLQEYGTTVVYHDVKRVINDYF